MSGGWAGSDRRARLPDDWEDRRAAVKARAGGRCEYIIFPRRGGYFRCGAEGADADHIDRGDDHSLGNLRWICPPHHRHKSSSEGNAAKAAIKARGRRELPQHPGFIRR